MHNKVLHANRTMSRKLSVGKHDIPAVPSLIIFRIGIFPEIIISNTQKIVVTSAKRCQRVLKFLDEKGCDVALFSLFSITPAALQKWPV